MLNAVQIYCRRYIFALQKWHEIVRQRYAPCLRNTNPRVQKNQLVRRSSAGHSASLVLVEKSSEYCVPRFIAKSHLKSAELSNPPGTPVESFPGFKRHRLLVQARTYRYRLNDRMGCGRSHMHVDVFRACCITSGLTFAGWERQVWR